MTEKEQKTTEAAQEAQEKSENQAPQMMVQINAQYIKDLSFEAPNNPEALLTMKKAPEISINVDVQAKNLKDKLYTVNLIVKASAKEDDKTVFLCELDYGSLVTLDVPKEQLEAFLLVEVPHLMFPAVRNIIADATRDGGFPPLLLNPIDFASLYRQKKQAEANKKVN